MPIANGIKCFMPKLCDAPFFVTIAGDTEVVFGFFMVVLAVAVALVFIELVVDNRMMTVLGAIFDMDVVFIFVTDVVFIFVTDVVLTFAMAVVLVRCVTGIVTVDMTMTVLTLCVLCVLCVHEICVHFELVRLECLPSHEKYC